MYQAEIRQIETERNKNIEDNRTLYNKAKAEGREFTAEENTTWESRNVAIERQDRRLVDLSRISKLDNSGDPNGENRSAGTPRLDDRGQGGAQLRHATDEYRGNFGRFLMTGEVRDMTLSNTASGGALLAPASVSADIVKQVDNLCYIKAKAKKYPVTSTQATGVRRRPQRMSAASWTTEIGNIGAADSAMTFDRRDLTPQALVKLVLVSQRLLMSGLPIEKEVSDELAYQFAIAEENGFLNGNGVGQPLGVYNTTHASAISTARDVITKTVGALKADDLIALKYSIKQPYLTGPDAAWVFGRPVMAAIRMLVDNYGQYIWRAGLSSDRPDTVLDIPFCISEYAPGAIATGNYVAVLGNWSYYGVAELVDIFVQRLVELYAATNEVGFKGLAWIDGQPLLDEAFGRLKVQ